MTYSLYIVGGYVRDKLLGIDSKDIDYSFVWDNVRQFKNAEQAFETMSNVLVDEGFEVFLKTPNCFTVRAMFPKQHKFSGVADFVMARKELEYITGTRTPKVIVGTLEDDLIRRDFTVNTLAISLEDNSIIDLFGGQKDLIDRVLRTPTDSAISINDDPLRILRAFRFAVTKNLLMSDELMWAIHGFQVDNMGVVSDERIREELFKMFKFNTFLTLEALGMLKEINSDLYYYLFEGDIWLKPTMEK